MKQFVSCSLEPSDPFDPVRVVGHTFTCSQHGYFRKPDIVAAGLDQVQHNKCQDLTCSIKPNVGDHLHAYPKPTESCCRGHGQQVTASTRLFRVTYVQGLLRVSKVFNASPGVNVSLSLYVISGSKRSNKWVFRYFCTSSPVGSKNQHVCGPSTPRPTTHPWATILSRYCKAWTRLSPGCYL